MSIKALETYLEVLKPCLRTEGVTEVCINKPGTLFVEAKGCFKQYTAEKLEFGFLEELAKLIAEFNFKQFPHPLLSGYLPTGERVQCVMPPACEKSNIIFSIRCHSRRNMSLEDYQATGVFDHYIAANENMYAKTTDLLKTLYEEKKIFEFLQLALIAKRNIIISGGTGSGKTTFLNACLQLIPDTERLITVEDTREVKVSHQSNSAHLLFNQDDEEITAEKLFKACLRLRPDRILLSELRGAEAWSFLRAANSGHPGSISTVHSDTPQGCFDQLVFMMQQAGNTSSEENLRAYIQSIIPIVIQLKRSANKKRFVEVAEIYFASA